jgi:hypothetical protein
VVFFSFPFFGDILSVLHCYSSIARLMELFDAKISQTFLDDLPRSCILTSSKGSVGRSVSVTVSWDGMHKDISTLLPPLASNTACSLQPSFQTSNAALICTPILVTSARQSETADLA